MSYVNPTLRDAFESLSIDLKNEILHRNVQLHTLHDLTTIVKDIVAEGR